MHYYERRKGLHRGTESHCSESEDQDQSHTLSLEPRVTCHDAERAGPCCASTRSQRLPCMQHPCFLKVTAPLRLIYFQFYKRPEYAKLLMLIVTYIIECFLLFKTEPMIVNDTTCRVIQV